MSPEAADMTSQKLSVNSQHQPSTKKLLTLITPISLLGLIGAGIWGILLIQPDLLPAADTEQGRKLLRSYLSVTHDFLIVSLAISTVILIFQITTAKAEEPKSNKKPFLLRSIRTIRSNPWATILFAAYTFALVNGTTYIYKDLISWYPELINSELLNNLSIRSSFITETMRRTDFRFIPLAHQDLHILSWFTVQIKSWIIVNSIELIATAILIYKFIKEQYQAQNPRSISTFLITSVLLLSHPSTITSFTHVIFCERILALIFAGYIFTYQRYQKKHENSSFYLAILLALIGLFVKDIAIILFATPPLTFIVAGSLGKTKFYPRLKWNAIPSWISSYKLEAWLSCLAIVFTTSYIILSLIPSTYAGQGVYSEGGNIFEYTGDIRFYFFLVICIARFFHIFSSKGKDFCLLDALNITALIYCIALGLSFKFDANSYLALPVQLIIVIDIIWAYLGLTSKFPNNKSRDQVIRYATIGAMILLIITEHATNGTSALTTYQEIKLEQESNQKTFDQLKKLTKESRENAEEVNIIINRNAAVSRENFLGQLNYDRLIEYYPESGQYRIKDGINKGVKTYQPAPGDIAVNIDKTIDDLDPILKGRSFQEIYRHNPTIDSGLIIKITSTEESKLQD